MNFLISHPFVCLDRKEPNQLFQRLICNINSVNESLDLRSTLKPVLHGAGLGLHLPHQKVHQVCGLHCFPMLVPGTSALHHTGKISQEKWAWNTAHSKWPSCTEHPGATVRRKSLPKKSGRRDPTAPSWHGYLDQSALVRFIHDLLPGSRTPRLQLSSVCIHTEHSNSPKTVKEKAFFQWVERFKMWKWPSVKYSNLWKVDITIPYNPGMAQQGHGNGFSDSLLFHYPYPAWLK